MLEQELWHTFLSQGARRRTRSESRYWVLSPGKFVTGHSAYFCVSTFACSSFSVIFDLCKQRVVVKFYFMVVKNYDRVLIVKILYKDDAIGKTPVYECFSHFKKGEMSTYENLVWASLLSQNGRKWREGSSNCAWRLWMDNWFNFGVIFLNLCRKGTDFFTKRMNLFTQSLMPFSD